MKERFGNPHEGPHNHNLKRHPRELSAELCAPYEDVQNLVNLFAEIMKFPEVADYRAKHHAAVAEISPAVSRMSSEELYGYLTSVDSLWDDPVRTIAILDEIPKRV
jgi:hypothetical protein